MKNNFTISEVRKHWNEVAKIYEPTNAIVGYVHTQRFEKAIKFSNIKSGDKVLNIWSRTGNLIPYLRKTPNVQITNMEASEKMIEIAEKKYPKEKFIKTDLILLSELENSYFDKIISLETLEHTPNPSSLLSEFYRVLKPGGKLVMSLPPGGFEIPTRLYDTFFNNHGEGPHRFLWSWEVKRLLKETGFKLINHQGYMMIPTKNDKTTRKSEEILTNLFGKTPLIEFGVRHFYVCIR